ncbi:MAG: hypothetical protein HY666_01215, partial [Chloroflexi bacterium]|nr:hypothetical protein [Chloroflexota bacterium]
LLQHLFTSPQAASLIHPKGVQIQGARIEGRLDLEGATVVHRLFIKDSAIDQGIVLSDARTRRLVLDGSHIGAIAGDNLVVGGSVAMRRTHVKGGLTLRDASIEGTLDCTGGHLENPGGNALHADRMTVKGGVFLRQGFQAKGEVRLPGASIEGPLDCTGGHLENPGGYALTLEQATVAGVAFLRSLELQGSLNLTSARVGQLYDDKGSWPAIGKLEIEGFEYAAFAGDDTPKSARERLEWLRLQPTGDFKPQTYDYLARVLRQMGREDDAATVMMAKQEDLIRRGQLNLWRKVVKRMFGWTVGHGYQSWRAMLGIFVFFVVGTLLFWWAERQGLMVPLSPEVLTAQAYETTGAIPQDYPPFQAWLYSLDTLLPIIDLHQEAFWQPKFETPLGWAAFLYLRLHIVAGWFLSALVAAASVGLVRRIE